MSTFDKVKPPSTKLCLVLEFDRPPQKKTIPDAAAHEKALAMALKATQLVPVEAAKIKVIDMTKMKSQKLDLEFAHHFDFDPANSFHVANTTEAMLRYEFFYSPTRLCIRAVTALGDTAAATVDGVTTLRLAFATMEALEGQKITSEFPLVPKYTYGWRNVLNFKYHALPGNTIRVWFALAFMAIRKWLGMKVPKKVTAVNSIPSLIRYWDEKDQEKTPGQYLCYRSEDKGAFKVFMNSCQEWLEKLGLTYTFYMINQSPYVGVGITRNLFEINSFQGRERGMFIPPDVICIPAMWSPVVIPITCNKMFINNYGKHQHNFSEVPTGFVWDWLEYPPHVPGATCLTLNGIFLCHVAGLSNAISQFPFPMEPTRKERQNKAWYSQVGPYVPTPPPPAAAEAK